jgi:penicillin-binding protein 1A
MDDTTRPTAKPEVGTIVAARLLAGALAAELGHWARRVANRAHRVARWICCSHRLFKAAIVGAMVVFLAAAGAMLWVLNGIPLQVRASFDGPSILVEAADGIPVGRVGTLGDAVRRDAIPEVLVKAVLSIEDRRFFNHHGVDLRGVARAAYVNWSAGGIIEGGSTITQQLAKLQLVGNERNFGRKFREALLAFWMETRLSKDEILTRYLNSVYLGAGVYGMSAAARHFFDKKLKDISLAEAALLAGVIQAPTRYNPTANPDAAQRRAAVVLDAMVEAKVIDVPTAELAKSQAASIHLSKRTEPAASWFADWIARHEYPKMAGTTARPMRVRTSIEPRLQAIAERVVKQTLDRDGTRLGASQAALVALRPDGAVVAMVGGRDYDESQFNRAVDARRQPGSAFKLFVYYAALRQGYRLDDVIDASPVKIKAWQPENYDGEVYDQLTLADAFARSTNSAAIRLALDVGLTNVVSAARELGLTSPLAEVPSMALGTNEVSLLDLTAAFASVRAGRARLEPWGISAFGIEGGGLRRLSAPSGPIKELAYKEEMTQLLGRVVSSGTGRGAALDDESAAGKTGTSQDYRDAWFVGFNRELVVGVWVGNDDRAPMNQVTGGALPATIWREFVTAAKLEMNSWPSLPDESDSSGPETPEGDTTAQCDVIACAGAFASFRASDCTYQPYTGPRRMCELRPNITSGLPRIARTAAVPGNSCDVDICASRFRSFDPATCTYQPYGGGSRAKCDIR